MVSHLTPEMLFDALAVRIIGPEAWDKKMAIEIIVPDEEATYHLWLSNGALIYSTAPQSGSVDVTLTGTAKQLTALAAYGPDPEALGKAGIKIDGDKSALDTFSSLFDQGDPDFNIVTP